MKVQCQNTLIGELKQLAQGQSKIRDIAINRNTVSYLGFGRSDNRDNIGSDKKKDSNEGSLGGKSGDKKESGRKRKSRGDDSDGNGSKGNRNKECKNIKEKCTQTAESSTQTSESDSDDGLDSDDTGPVTGGLFLSRLRPNGHEFL